MPSAADEKRVRERDEEEKRERQRELEDVRLILDKPEGRRFFRRLFDKGRVFQTTFTGNSTGMFLEGHRNLALMFLDDIQRVAPERIPDLMKQEETEEDDG